MQVLALKFGQNGQPLTVTFIDAEAAPVSLSGATVTLEVWHEREGSKFYRQAGTVINAAAGMAQFTVTRTGLAAQSGQFAARAVASWTNGTVDVPTEQFVLDVQF